MQTFAALKVHGATAITCLTAQNPGKISRLEPCPPTWSARNWKPSRRTSIPAAAKTGMLYSARDRSRSCALLSCAIPEFRWWLIRSWFPPADGGFLQADGIEALKKHLLPLAAIVTPNLAEAEILTWQKNPTRSSNCGRRLGTIYRSFGCAALVKGGHLPGDSRAVDFFHGPEGEWMLSSPRSTNVGLHGTGCTYSAAIAAWLARGKSRIKAAGPGQDLHHPPDLGDASRLKFPLQSHRASF